MLTILLMNLFLRLTDAKSSPKLEGGLENLVEKLEFRLRDVELRLEETEIRMKNENEKQAKEKKELEAKNKEMETRLGANPVVLISAWRYGPLTFPQTVTFQSFLTNLNNGSGELDLYSGVFTCFTPGYYTVSFSAFGEIDVNQGPNQYLYFYKNGSQLDETFWRVYMYGASRGTYIGTTGSRIVILHLDVGDTVELRMTEGYYVHSVSLNIELTALGFDFLV